MTAGDDHGFVPPEQARRVELLLHQLESLPTLPAVAVRLLELTSGEVREPESIIRLIGSDPALSSKILRMCQSRWAHRASRISSMQQAVDHLGIETLRAAALSLQVMPGRDGQISLGGECWDGDHVFQAEAFWHHSVATALLCRALAASGQMRMVVDPEEVYVAGLLHDLGVLALHVLLPQSMARVVSHAQSAGVTLAQSCRRVLGLTTHTVGRRLAEHWHLPHVLGDVLWLHGQPSETLPKLPHRPVIELVSLADAVARARFVSPAGHGPRGEDLTDLVTPLGLSVDVVEDIAAGIRDEVTTRLAMLGLDRGPSLDQLTEAMCSANLALGRLQVAAQHRARHAESHAQTLDAITEFHDSAAPGGSIVAVLGKVARSAQSTLGGGFFALLYQVHLNDPWQLMQFASDGRLVASEVIDPPAGSTAVADMADQMQVSVQVLGMLPWLSAYLVGAPDLARVRLLPLRCGWGVNAVLIHDCPVQQDQDLARLSALSRTWAAAIAAATHHSGAKKLGEQLAESNRALLETRGELMRREKLASLGEIAAGAAHEMNNPLTVISGRAQLLANRLEEPDVRAMAEQVVQQSHRLSDMISSLRSFAEPIEPYLQPISLSDLLDPLVQSLYRDHGDAINVRLTVDPDMPDLFIDPDQIGRAIRELLRNAVESEGSSDIELRVHIDPLNDRLQVQVVDDGIGLSKHALAHAFDPFFSVKSAGRQPGLGLAHARRLVEAHGGRIKLENGTTRGAVATIRLPEWRVKDQSRHVA